MEPEKLFKQKTEKKWTNKSRTLIVCSRGAAAKHRHLMIDLYNLLPHAKKDFKLEKYDVQTQLQDLCQMHSCNSLMYLEAKKQKYLYLNLARSPMGPTAKFQRQFLVRTSEELKLTGNCIKGSRPVISFDASFDKETHLSLVKQLLILSFSVPQYHPKSKPFIDHIFQFTVASNKIWFRNYQVCSFFDSIKQQQIFHIQEGPKNIKTELVEIGPRFVLNPVVFFDGCMSGLVLYSNILYLSPSLISKEKKKKEASLIQKQLKKKIKKEKHINKLVEPLNNTEFNYMFHDSESQEE